MRRLETQAHRPFLSLLLCACASLLLAVGCSPVSQLDDTGHADTTAPEDTTAPDDDTGGSDTSDPDTGDTVVEVTDLRIPGLSDPVQAVYDANGMLHLQCLTDADCAAALGYFHAANRFFFMDFGRLNYRGQVGSAAPLGGDLGAAVLAEDMAKRHFMSTPQGQPLEEAMLARLDDEQRMLIERYTDGVNAWLGDVRAGRNDAKLSPEYDLGILYPGDAAGRAGRIRDWEPADSMAVALSVADGLSNDTQGELSQGILHAALTQLDLTLASDLMVPRPAFEAATMPASGVDFGTMGFDVDGMRLRTGEVGARLAGTRELLEATLERLEALPDLGTTTRGGGSNNWVVAPARTSAGHVLLANDPHLPLYNPSVWFPVELDSKSAPGASGTIHCAGGSFAGLPVLLIGHCEHIAWGVTTAYWDLTDVYTETLSADGSAVLFEGQEVPIVEREVAFQSNNETVTRTLRWVPHHGPILSQDLDAGTAVTSRWVAHDGAMAEDLGAFFGMMRAQNLAEARSALENLHAANQNFVVVDDAGNIGWFPWVRLPQRPWDWAVAPPWLPLPGDGSAEWGPTPFGPAELPSMENPPAGFIATANQDHTGAYFDGDPSDNQGMAQSFGKANGVRMQRIVDLLEQHGDAHSVQTMLAIQADTYALIGEALVPAVLAASASATLSPAAQHVVDALSAWQYTCPTGLDGTAVDAPPLSDPTAAAESIGCTAFHVVFFEVLGRAFDDEAAAAGLEHLRAGAGGTLMGTSSRMLAEALLRPEQLASGERFWDDRATPDTVETRDDILLAALIGAAERLSAPTVVAEGDEPGLGPDPDAWRWGRIHQVSLASPYNTFSADLTAFNDGPWANDGGLFTVDVAPPRDRFGLDYAHGHGASIRIVVEMTPQGPVMQLQLPGGTSLDRRSQRYSQLLQNWLVNEPVTMPFGLDAVSDPQLTLEVLPAEQP